MASWILRNIKKNHRSPERSTFQNFNVEQRLSTGSCPVPSCPSPHDNDSLSLRGCFLLLLRTLQLQFAPPTTRNPYCQVVNSSTWAWTRTTMTKISGFETHGMAFGDSHDNRNWRHLRRFQMWDFQRLWQGMGQMQCTWTWMILPSASNRIEFFFFFTFVLFEGIPTVTIHLPTWNF